MLRTVLAGVLIITSTALLAQYNKKYGVGIQYNMLMLENDRLKDVHYEYQPGMASAFTKLFEPEMKSYSKAFLDYVDRMVKVKNYVGPLGTEPATSMGDRGFEEAIKKIDNGKLERVGRMYMEVAQYEGFVQRRNDSIIVDDGPNIHDVQIIYNPDTVYSENLETEELERTIVKNEEYFFKSASGAGFIEEWDYDHRQGAFEKNIKYLSLLVSSFDEEGQYRGLQYLFTFKSGKFNKKHINSEQLVRKDIEYNVLFNRDFTLGDEEINYGGMARTSHAFGYIEPTERIQFLISILHNVKNGQLGIYEYDPIDFDINHLEKVHNISWFEGLNSVDTVYVENLETGEMEQIEIQDTKVLGDVVGIRFFEDWYMDPDNMSMYKRVNGVVFLKEVIDNDTGLPKGVAPISNYYIKLNPIH